MKFYITLTLLFLLSLGISAQITIVNNKVGVGDFSSTNPQKELEVKGDILIPNGGYYLAKRTNGSVQQLFTLDAYNDVIFNRSALVGSKPTSGLIFGCSGPSKWIDFWNNSNVPMMKIHHDNGRVGIGMSHEIPTEKLQVNGNIKADNVLFQSPNDGETYLSIHDMAIEQQRTEEKLETLESQLTTLQTTLTALQQQNEVLLNRIAELERQ